MTPPADRTAVQVVTIHGHRRAFVMAGSGPVVVLLHGLGHSSATWAPVLEQLATRFTVVAPDLLGHGRSDKPRGDYSLGGYANGVRDLLTYLGIERATVVGHSFGGGVAMQFGYQFPERTERICLVAPGGLGPEVSPLIRLLAVPGAGLAVGALTTGPLRPLVRTALRTVARTGLLYTHDLDEVAGVLDALSDRRGRSAIRHVTSHVVDWRGQVVTMTDRAYLAALVPVCIVWGSGDRAIPVAHAHGPAVEASHAQVHVFEGSGHFPHKDEPERFVEVLVDFVESTVPARHHRGRWRAVLRRGDRPELSPVHDPTASDVVEQAATTISGSRQLDDPRAER